MSLVWSKNKKNTILKYQKLKPIHVKYWTKISDHTKLIDEEFIGSSVGVIVLEKDGRVWVNRIKHINTFPRIRINTNKSNRALAMQIAYEQLGLLVEILYPIVDIYSTTQYNRFYLAKRIAGSPETAKSDMVILTSLDKVRDTFFRKDKTWKLELLEILFNYTKDYGHNWARNLLHHFKNKYLRYYPKYYLTLSKYNVSPVISSDCENTFFNNYSIDANITSKDAVNSMIWKVSLKKHPDIKLVVKIIPVVSNVWDILLKKIGLSNFIKGKGELTHKLQSLGISYRNYNIEQKTWYDNIYNEFTIMKKLSDLTLTKVTPCFIQLTDYFNCDFFYDTQIQKFENINFKYLIMPEYKTDWDKQIELFQSDKDLIVFQLQFTLYISYYLLKFVHGDILLGKNNNVMYHMVDLPKKKYVVFQINHLDSYYVFPIKQQMPVFVLFDYGYSDIRYYQDNKIVNINQKVPMTSINEYPIGDIKTLNLKRKQDIEGLNNMLYVIYNEKPIKYVSLADNYKFPDTFVKQKLNYYQFLNLKLSNDEIYYFGLF